MQEQWSRWEPVGNLSTKYDIDSISDGMDGFKIELTDCRNTKNRVYVTFEDSVYAHRSTDEGFRLNTIHILDEQYGADFYGKWTFFKVTNSTYIQWLSEESFTVVDSLSLMHFSLLAANVVLDIVAGYEPRIEFITLK